MIPVRDLCIGNWVYDGERTQFPMWVQTIGEDYVYLDFEGNEGDLWESKPEDLQGIPLTGELLTRVGLEKITNRTWWSETNIAGITFETRITFWSEAKIQIQITRQSPNYKNVCDCSTVFHLHELQNLFWNITNQQLKIEL